MRKTTLEDLLLESEAAISEVRSYHSLGAAARLETLAQEIQQLLGGDVKVVDEELEEVTVPEEETGGENPFGFGF